MCQVPPQGSTSLVRDSYEALTPILPQVLRVLPVLSLTSLQVATDVFSSLFICKGKFVWPNADYIPPGLCSSRIFLGGYPRRILSAAGKASLRIAFEYGSIMLVT